MEKAPQIVSERLKVAAVAAPDSHPDADVLTAFAERSLRNHERASVLDHLARCVDCREIVALALPESEASQFIVRPERTGWFAWPALRWGLIAAGVVVLASFGLIEYEHQRSGPIATASKDDSVLLRTEPGPVSQPSPSDPSPAANSDATIANLKSPGALVPPAAGTPSRVRTAPIGGTLQHGPKVQWQQNTQNLQYQVSSPAPQRTAPINMNSTAAAGAQPAAAVDDSRAIAKENVATTAQLQPPAQLSQPSLDARVVRTKPAMAASANAPSALAIHGGTLDALKSSSPGSLVSWRVSESGGLQRSFDQGNSWADLNVNDFGQPAGLALAKNTARTDGGKSFLKKTEAETKDRPVFRAVSANGADVWAGANGGLLYHSSDGGNSWTRVIPTASGISLTGDILSLEFVDAQNGRLVTSTPETWTTSNSGQTWQRQ